MRVFVTHILPKNKFEKYRVAIAANNFSYNLIDAGLFDRVYSILPSNVSGRKDDFLSEDYRLVYSRLRRKRHFCKIASQIENVKLFFQIKNGDFVWFYNIDVLSALCFTLLKLFKRNVKLFPVVLDFTPGAKYSDFCLSLINKADGLIKLSNSELFAVKNAVCLPGVVPNNCYYNKIAHPIKRNFLLSGVLSEHIALTSVVLEAFSRLKDVELTIVGFTRNDEKILDYSKKFNNINYWGKVSKERFQYLLDTNPFVLSTRDKEFSENKCNFPSKIIEALLHNRIVISTLHYDQLNEINYFEIPDDIDGMTDSIRMISNMSDEELMAFANQSEKVEFLFSTEKWSETMTAIEKGACNEVR